MAQLVHLQCDATLRGIGAALLQPDADGELRPIAYASKSLTPTEHHHLVRNPKLNQVILLDDIVSIYELQGLM